MRQILSSIMRRFSNPGRGGAALVVIVVLLPVASFLSLAATSFVALQRPTETPPAAAGLPIHVESKHAANPVACGTCHRMQDGAVPPGDHFLNQRSQLEREAWADSAHIDLRCGGCHLVPEPADLPTGRWRDAIITFMSKVMYYRGEAAGFAHAPVDVPYRQWMNNTRGEWMDVLHYYLAFSEPEEKLAADPPVTSPPFEPMAIGEPAASGPLPQIAHVNVVDLDGNGRLDVLVSDFQQHAISVVRREGYGWAEKALAAVPFPGHTEVGDYNGDGELDIIVANVGSRVPTDNPVGSVELLEGRGNLEFDRTTLLEGVGRVSDVRPGDFDGDGDVDFVVAVFGFIKEGGIGWLERMDDGEFRYHPISSKAGAVHVPPVDLNGDGRLDFIALISQQYEEVSAFVNAGDGRFDERILFKADSPTFGSSGIELTDLDQDGDVDILYTNGDAFDLSAPMFRPVHGVQWLENRGEFHFTYHDLIRFYGAYRALPVDVDGDDDLDIVAVSLISDWTDPDRKSMIWLENDGAQNFTPQGIANAPTAIITADVGDLDGDGLPDVVTGSMHLHQSDPRRGRIALWKNTTAASR